jgi:hypothetical protein
LAFDDRGTRSPCRRQLHHDRAPDDRDEDLYLSRDSGPAGVADHDFIAAARNLMIDLLDEIDRLRGELERRSPLKS